MRLEDTVAVVTGAARGIGAASARRLAEAGAEVVLVDLLERVHDTASGIDTETAGSATALEADVADEDSVQAMAERVEQRHGPAEVLVNNAGIRRYGPVTEVDEESWDAILGVNLKGYAFCAKHLIPGMADSGGGAVVNVSSIHAEVGRPGMAQYDATKGGVLSLTRSLAADHGDQGVRANAVLPGPVLTEFHVEERGMDPSLTEPSGDGPGIMNRWAEPREIADGVLFLASEASSFMTGRKLLIDGGTGFEMDPV